MAVVSIMETTKNFITQNERKMKRQLNQCDVIESKTDKKNHDFKQLRT